MDSQVTIRDLRLFEDYIGFDDHFVLPMLNSIRERPVIVICEVRKLSANYKPQGAAINVWGKWYTWLNWYEGRRTTVEHAIYMLDRREDGSDLLFAVRIQEYKDTKKLRSKALEVFKNFKKRTQTSEPQVILVRGHIGYES